MIVRVLGCVTAHVETTRLCGQQTEKRLWNGFAEHLNAGEAGWHGADNAHRNQTQITHKVYF